jgi:hypothetical protein
MALAGKNAKVLAYSTEVTFTAEATTTTDNTNYQITNINKRVWGNKYPILVYKSAVLTIEPYTLDRLRGVITFTTSSVRTITVSGSYLPTVIIAEAKGYDYVLEGDSVDTTIFSDQFKLKTQALKTITGTLDKFYDISNYFFNTLISDTDFILEFYVNGASTADVRAWIKISKDDINAAVDNVVTEKVDFEGTTDPDGRCVSFGPF